MSIFTRIFRRRKKAEEQKQISSEHLWRLTCRYCGESYVIGEDAQIVTAEDVQKSLLGHGALDITSLGQPRSHPDLVMHWVDSHGDRIVADEGQKEEQRKKAAEIKAAIAQGQERLWRCAKCRHEHEHPNKYPRSFGGK